MEISSLSAVVRVGNVRDVGQYPWFFDCRLGVRQLASADRSPLVPTAAAFVGGGDWYRSRVLWDASEVCHAARGSRHRIPKTITANDVQRLLDSCDISGPIRVRDYAILMLVARLGLRSIEAARLPLDDVDWRAGRIVLRGKASREDGMPLPADVGDA